MGMVISKIKIYGNTGMKELDLMVDTGATFTKLPLSVAKELGIEGRKEIEVELADGRRGKRRFDIIEIEVDGIKRPLPITIGDDERGFIGYTALEILGFKVNPILQRLDKVTPIEYMEADLRR